MIFAYIDPASGSILFQVILAGMLGAGVFFRNYLISPLMALKSRFGGKGDDVN